MARTCLLTGYVSSKPFRVFSFDVAYRRRATREQKRKKVISDAIVDDLSPQMINLNSNAYCISKILPSTMQ